MSNQNIHLDSVSNNKILAFLISVLFGITILYQLRPLLDDNQFALVSFSGFTIIPAILVTYAAYLTIKLFRKNRPQAKAFLFFTLGVSFLFIAEQNLASI